MKTAVIVDAYRFSKDYVHALSIKNISRIHVQSTLQPLVHLSGSSTYLSSDYDDHLFFNHQHQDLISDIKKWDAPIALPGMESGVTLADELNHFMEISSNDFSLSKARRNKYEMLEALNNAGIPCMKYALVFDISQAIAWVENNSIYPVVIKPLEGAGTEGVYVCETKDALMHYFSCIQGQKNCLGIINHAVLIQEFLNGTEYMINSVSCMGSHYFTDIWCCHKKQVKNHGVIYDREILIESNGKTQNELKSYLLRVLNALGFNQGAAHAEVMMTERGPILIEIGARVGGNVNCDAHTACLGKNQLELCVDSYFDHEKFFEKTVHGYAIKKQMMTILLSTEQSGFIVDMPIVNVINQCHSLYWYRMNSRMGDLLKPTRDLFTSPGKIILMHEDDAVIKKEYEMIQEAMEYGFELADGEKAL